MKSVIYTIGFAGRSAEAFFSAIERAEVRSVVDIRIRPSGQLAGFARKKDLPYFLDRLACGCGYRHVPELAPSSEMMRAFRKSHNWEEYVAAFEALMDERGVPATLAPGDFERACLLCSEATPEQCHRRLVAERLAAAWPGTELRHL